MMPLKGAGVHGKKLGLSRYGLKTLYQLMRIIFYNRILYEHLKK